MSLSKPFKLFGPGIGGPADNYRIPSMVVTNSGTIVACADARYFTGNDNPNRIDKVVRRSTDSGETWGEFILAVKEHGESKEESSAAIDPSMVYVPEINRIYMFYCYTPAGVGILNCVRSVGEDENGNPLVKGKKRNTFLKTDISILSSAKRQDMPLTRTALYRKTGERYAI